MCGSPLWQSISLVNEKEIDSLVELLISTIRLPDLLTYLLTYRKI